MDWIGPFVISLVSTKGALTAFVVAWPIVVCESWWD